VLNNIEKLLKKYESGETSPKEEQQLKNYFLNETVAPHLEMYKPMFNYFSTNKKEQFTKSIAFFNNLGTKNKFNFKWLSIAAFFVLMVSFYVFRLPNKEELTLTDADKIEINNAKVALAIMSKHFNHGAAQVSYLGEINKAGTQVDYLKEITNPMDRLFKR